MIGVVPQAREVLGSELPLYGSEAQAYAMTATLQSVIDDMGDLRHLVTLALADLGMLQGDGLGALTTFLTEDLMTGRNRLSDDVETASQAFSRFARTCDTLNETARSMLLEGEVSLDVIRGAWHQVRVAAAQLGPQALSAVPDHWRIAPVAAPPDEHVCLDDTVDVVHARSAWQTAATAWRRALEEIASLRERWSRLVEQRRDAEQRLAVTLDASFLLTTMSRASTEQGARGHLSYALTGRAARRPSVQEHPELKPVLSGGLTPHETATLWRRSRYASMSAEGLAALPLDVLVGLASAPGIPARVQDIASRTVLAVALTDPQDVYRLMGFAGSSMSLAHFTEEMRDIEDALFRAEAGVAELLTVPPVQLLGLGNHADHMTATLVAGDLDTASHVGVNVSGMFSQTSTMAETFPAVTGLLAEATVRYDEHSFAVAHWIGYRSPGILPGENGVLDMHRAQAGGYELSRFIDGALASREHPSATLPEHVVIMGHSYGSTTAAEASKLMHYEVDHLVTYGSAGIDLEHMDQLNLVSMSATSAWGDQVAWMGILGGRRTDPRHIDGVQPFTSTGGEGYRRVTMHDMYAGTGESSLVNPTKTGYLSAGTRSLEYMSEVLAGNKGHP